jgi:hypothetical protein
MLWFAMLPGVALTVLGIAALFADAPTGVAATAIGLGIFWIAMLFFAIRTHRRFDRLRHAFVQADPEAAKEDDMLRRLSWLQWTPLVLGFVWVFATIPFAENNVNLPIYGFVGSLALCLAVMLHRTFLMANLSAAASRALKQSLSGQETSQLTPLQRFGAGAFTVVLMLAILGGVLADEYADLPVKFTPLFWWGIGVLLVGAAAYRLWRVVHSRLLKRHE